MLGGSGVATSTTSAGGSLADEVVSSALRYRSQAPLIDHLLGELGLSDGGDINALTRTLLDSQFRPTEGVKPNGAQPNPPLSNADQSQSSPNTTNTPKVELASSTNKIINKVSNKTSDAAVSYTIKGTN